MCGCFASAHAWCSRRPGEDLGSPGTGDTDGCESPGGCWELSLGLLDERPVLLTAELSFQPIGGGDVLFHFIFVLFCFRYTFLSEFGGVAQICNPGTWEVGVDRT